MKIALNIILTPIVFVLCLPIAVCIAIFYLFKFPIDMVIATWEGE